MRSARVHAIGEAFRGNGEQPGEQSNMCQAYRRLGPVVVVLGVVACQSSQGASNGLDDSVRVVNVEVTPVTASRFTDFIRITGEVVALHDVVLSAEEAGRITAFRVEKGSAVQRGQVIAQLADEVLRAQTDEARAAAQLAREQFERQRRLWQDEHIGSEMAFLQARANAEAATARVATLEARLERTRIRAPVEGIFDEKLAEAGELATPGTRIARVVATRQLKVTGGVPERYGLAIQRGARAEVGFDVLPDQAIEGRIAFVGASVDPTNRTFPIEILLDNPGGRIKPHMVANVRLVREQLEGVIVVPQQVVERTENGYQVFLVEEENEQSVARARPVRLGPSSGNRVVVEEGLAAGDRLITVGQQLVDDGSRVRVVSPAMPTGQEES